MRLSCLIAPLVFAACLSAAPTDGGLQVSPREYLDRQGLSVLLYHNTFHPVFVDQKVSAMEVILHGRRIATNGDIRLVPTPEQWDAVPTFQKRVADAANRRLTAYCSFPKYGMSYRLEVQAEGDGLRVAIHLDRPLPPELAGVAGFNLEFLPSAFFGKTFMADETPGIFPRHPGGGMAKDRQGRYEPKPIASGRSLVLAPEDPLTRVSIMSDTAPLALFDGRTMAQNGWFVVRSAIPSGRTADAIVWHVRPNVVPGWVRPPVIAHSQVGYHPAQPKVAVVETDPAASVPDQAALLRLEPAGEYREVFRGPVKPWGKWMRLNYARFDFTAGARQPGIYVIEYEGRRTEPFRVAADVYRNHVWQPSLDTYLPVQMDHVSVREAYRVWHGLSHMDDARQAPTSYTHFDGYASGPSTDTKFQPGEHIPGLNVGGWYDAGDFDIRTQTQYRVISDLATAFERFKVDWDDTSVDRQARAVEMRRPDGVPDAVQQVEHGVLQILAQFHAVGHAINGIVEPTLQQYTHLGDGASKTDGRVYSPKLGRLESEGDRSGAPDDRWAFTTRTTGLQYGGAATLAAASRVLKGYNDALANECLKTAQAVWTDEHGRPPALFSSFNTTGGSPADEEIRAAVELLLATNGGAAYRARLQELLPSIGRYMAASGWNAVRALPFMDEAFKSGLEQAVRAHLKSLEPELARNPFGVPIRASGWGGATTVADFGVRMYFLHRAFPDAVGPEHTLRAMEYLLGTHPVSSTSWVSGVGTKSRLMAYGSNRADYTFIPGGMVPGLVIVNPDFPEFIEGWPFLWSENEYVVDAASAFILLANAADDLVR